MKTRLKRRAVRHGRSMEDEVRHILRNATKADPRVATRNVQHFAGSSVPIVNPWTA